MKEELFYTLGCRKCAATPVSLAYETRARDRSTAVFETVGCEALITTDCVYVEGVLYYRSIARRLMTFDRRFAARQGKCYG